MSPGVKNQMWLFQVTQGERQDQKLSWQSMVMKLHHSDLWLFEPLGRMNPVIAYLIMDYFLEKKNDMKMLRSTRKAFFYVSLKM